MALQFLAVALGGALGASMRYAVGLIPVHTDFPVLTLLINFIGAVAIGCIASFAMQSNWNLFWKTGVCGGFTTFSTFSLETVQLLEQKVGWGIFYVLLSLLLCLGGIMLGRCFYNLVR